MRSFAASPGVAEIVRGWREDNDNILITAMRGGAGAALAAVLQHGLEQTSAEDGVRDSDAGQPATAGPRAILLVTSSLERAEALTDGIGFFGGRPLIFPALETLPFEESEPVLHIAAARNEVIDLLSRMPRDAAKAAASSENAGGEAPPLVVAPVDALMPLLLPTGQLEKLVLEIEWGDTVDFEAMTLRLVDMGYVREVMAESPGEFAIRGSIVDIYPADAEIPWRLDFFGDELESIRLFDPATQRSLPREEEIERVRILPRANLGPAMRYLAGVSKRTVSKRTMKSQERVWDRRPRRSKGEEQRAKSETGGADSDPATHPLGVLHSFFDLLPPSTLIILDGPLRVSQRLDYFDQVAARHWEEIQSPPKDSEPSFFLEHGLEPADWILGGQAGREALREFRRIEWAELSIETEELSGEDRKKENRPRKREQTHTVSIGAQSFESMTSNFKNFLELMSEKQAAGYQIVVVCDNQGQVQRLDELLWEGRVTAAQAGEKPEERTAKREEDGANDAKKVGSSDSTPRSLPIPLDASSIPVMLLIGELHEGFILPSAKLLVLTDREIFGRYKRRRIYRKAHHGKLLSSPSEIQRGDYVVHADHGIGQFEMIRRQSVDGRMCEFLQILYLDGDRLLVPVEKLHLVQKYASADGKIPALDRMGSKKWKGRRKKTQESIRKLAGELLQLYAQRETAYKPPFGPDTVWQQEFEASFIYQETPDQLKAIKEVKADLMKPRPSDRLICGDVGFGKTEVAIRAAFKVLVENRQVALLCPTTILAQQHYQTFKERLADYPFRVDMLSRFRSAARQKETLRDLLSGEVHLVVGTHRLISKDVKFRDLGLLIIDEEQRFGVKQKERIKSMRTEIDVLTLTATPIPRTLHMALAKVRDLSIIQTPPADRHPIKTRTIYFEKDYLEEAILRELNRGGQVFFVHNRIATIQDVAKSVREMVPQARLAVAHGRMDETELEGIMLDFIAGKFDILISTTIIENGIDIPNVNTIIINRADAMGLAQLYQLRGRVGRDVRQAYAYLILPRGKPITDTAMKRLAALEEFSELGMGFSIAMRDMEIRGTGNILGAEQSGAINDVGFDLYCKLLEEAIIEVRGKAPAEALWPTEVKWPVDQWLPESYVPVEAQRIRLYRELSAARELDQINLIDEELGDRYGSPPPETTNLLNAFRVKLAFASLHVEVVRRGPDGSIRLGGCEDARAVALGLDRLRAEADWIDRVSFRAGGPVIVHLADQSQSPEDVLAQLAKLVIRMPEPEPGTEVGGN
ncbi:transcription-repair coupling factor [Candidatus Sumerlaeota bacterium]|nr:transcription-repair coupling factor [Candidatus Sumerlaeota bacterium]